MSDDADFNYEQPGSTPDVGDIHRALIQEHMEPHEGDERVPVLLFLFFIGLAMWGGWYISEFDGGFYYSVLDGPAAFRQVDYSQNPNNAGPVDPVKLGRRVFNTCVTCHQTTGEGLPGKYPPLNGSEWRRILASSTASTISLFYTKTDWESHRVRRRRCIGMKSPRPMAMPALQAMLPPCEKLCR